MGMVAVAVDGEGSASRDDPVRSALTPHLCTVTSMFGMFDEPFLRKHEVTASVKSPGARYSPSYFPSPSASASVSTPALLLCI